MRAIKRVLPEGMPAVIGVAIAGVVLHVLFNNRYGYFRDEFDYIICGRHPAWGYVDHPPLLPLLSRIFIGIFGESLRSIRLIPALSSGVLVVITGMIARELGGNRFALILSAISVVIAPAYVSGGSLLVTNCNLEPLLWMGCAYSAIIAIKRDAPRYWLWFGLIAGIGFQEKYSIAVFLVSVLLGLLFTPERRLLLSRWILIGGAAALLIALPNLVWNVQHDWPFLQLMRNIKASGRDIILQPWDYFVQQLLIISPASAPLWIAGILAFLTARRFKLQRFLGWAYILSLTIFIVLKGKNYYLAPIYPVFLAAGSVLAEEFFDRIRQSWLKPVVLAWTFAGGAVLAPLIMPVLRIDSLIWYMSRLPVKAPRTEHSHERIALPQHYADQFGWDDIVAKTAEVWQSLPVEERQRCGIFAQNYGQAGAIDFLGPRYGLPPSISGHQTWWLWGPRGYSGDCLIVLDDTREKLNRLFDRVEFAGNSKPSPHALESEIPFYVCRGSKFGTLESVWPTFKHWR